MFLESQFLCIIVVIERKMNKTFQFFCNVQPELTRFTLSYNRLWAFVHVESKNIGQLFFFYSQSKRRNDCENGIEFVLPI